ncbi:MAG: cellulase family glycosylhydrolase, partial [Clostridia bacterium]|nr:cellulase family glycosylhydrolase [Clostridia bacterium]
MKKLIAVFLSVLLVLCVCGCGEESGGGSAAITTRNKPLEYGLNAHIYEQRAMDPSATMDYIVDMTDILGVTYYRLSTPHDSLFMVGEGDTLVFKEGFKDLVHQIIEKMRAVGVTHFVAVSDSPIYPYGYRVTSSGVVPDPLTEKELYLRWLNLYAKAWGMIAKEFPEITHIEPMNEPDLPGTNMFTKQGHQWGADDGYRYSMTDKAHMIADLQYYIYKEVKAANPNASVTTPGFSTYGEAQDILDYLYEAIESGAHPYGEDYADTDPDHYFDYINFHKYLSNMTLDEYFEHCDTFYKACERHGDSGKPALLTEWGF